VYWEELDERDPNSLCRNALAKNYSPMGLILPFLNEVLLIDGRNRCLHCQVNGEWQRANAPLLELLCLLYLLRATPDPLHGEMVSVQELKCAHFFRGPHELNLRPLLRRFGNDAGGFLAHGAALAGQSLELADASFRLMPFPKVPLYCLLWRGDQEFEPTLSILFDRSVEHHLAADAIWGLVNLMSDILLSGNALKVMK
jgi:hypothetical protein